MIARNLGILMVENSPNVGIHLNFKLKVKLKVTFCEYY